MGGEPARKVGGDIGQDQVGGGAERTHPHHVTQRCRQERREIERKPVVREVHDHVEMALEPADLTEEVGHQAVARHDDRSVALLGLRRGRRFTTNLDHIETGEDRARPRHHGDLVAPPGECHGDVQNGELHPTAEARTKRSDGRGYQQHPKAGHERAAYCLGGRRSDYVGGRPPSPHPLGGTSEARLGSRLLEQRPTRWCAREPPRSGTARLRLVLDCGGLWVDALTPLAWWGSRTSESSWAPRSSRCRRARHRPPPWPRSRWTTSRGGRFILGLGVSGPQVVEGWYGQPYPRPLARTREYIEIVRTIVAREKPVEFHGDFYDLPFPGGAGLGKPLKSTVHPLRVDLPDLFRARRARRTWRSPPSCAMAGCRCSSRPRRGRRVLSQRPERGLPQAGAPCAPRLTSRWSAPCRSSSTMTWRRPPTWCAQLGAVHRRDGCPGRQLPLRGLRPHGLRGPLHPHPGAVSGRARSARRRRW